MEAIYQLWRHRSNHETYAVRVVWRPRFQLTGVAGPLDSLSESPSVAELAACHYEDGARVQALAARREEFTVHVPRA